MADPYTAADTAEARECPYVTGTVTRYCTLTPFALTEEERDVLRRVADDASYRALAHTESVVRGILERCG